MRRQLQRLATFVAGITLLVWLAPTSWVEAAGGRIADLKSTTLELTNSKPLAVALVDGSGTQLVSFGGGTQYAEDSAHVSADTLTLAGVVQSAACGTALSGSGDRSLLQVDASGYLCVAGGTAGTQYTEDAAAAADPVGTVLNLVRKDTPAATVSADGDNIALRGSNFGAAYVTLLTSAGAVVPTSTAGSGTIDSNTSRITIATDDPVNDAMVKLDAQMVADDAASAGNPVYIGALASASIVGDAPVADGDRTGLASGLDRVLITRPHSNLEDRVSAVVGVTDGSSTSLVAAQGAGVRFCATTLVVANSSASAVTVDIRDGTAGSVIATIPAAANAGGAAITLQTPLCTTANTAMAMDPSAAASTVTVTAIGFKTEL